MTEAPGATVPATVTPPEMTASASGELRFGAPPGSGVAVSRLTVIVRRTGLDWRPVSGSVATRVMTFEPGRSSTRIENAPLADAVAVGFSRRPSTVIWASGTVSPRRTYDVPA